MSSNIWNATEQKLEQVSGNVNVNDSLKGTGTTYSSEKIEEKFSDVFVNLGDLSDKIPFEFGITEDGQYGYKKVGADSVIPFKSGGNILEGLIPVMTGNTSPKGVASASSTYVASGYNFNPYRALDGNNGTYWASNVSGVNQWIQYKFDSPVTVKVVKWKEATTSTRPIDYQIQASNDGNTWDTLYSESGNTESSKTIVIDGNKIKPYLYFRIYGTKWATNQGWCGISRFQVYGDITIEDIEKYTLVVKENF